jgi:serine/threonine protein kinase/tetratricopeptide (TPR) repeat protein
VGEVWRAHGATGGRKFALKLLRPEYAQHPQLRRRFAREARAASRLSHPNLVTVYAFGNDADEQLYIAMELADGPSITEAVQVGLSYRNILELADRLLAGLAHAHARGVIHRDLKPDNVLLAGAKLPKAVGTPKIVDFGIATVPYEESLTTDRDTQQGEVVGTPRYMSPEQAMGERNLGPRTDIYNVGLILYELISGEPPFGDETGLAVMSRHVHEEIPPLAPRPGLNVPQELVDIVDRALEKKALDRWSSAGEMRAALQELLDFAREDPGSNEQPSEMPEPPAGLDDDGSRNTRPQSRPDLIEATRGEDSEAFPGLDFGFGPWSFRVPFVGRKRERKQLKRIADRVLDTGHGAIVLLEGEAGVGKSRLCRWLREQVEERGVFRANSGAFTRGGTESLRGVQEVLESMFRTRGLPRERLAKKVAERLEEWGHDSPEDAAALIDFLRPTGIDETRPTTVSTEALFALIARIMEIGARRKPRLILLDDIHWAGRELADFLEYLAVELRHRDIPILLIATIRTEDLAERPELESRILALNRFQGESVERWALERLETVAGRDLVTKLLPCDEDLAEVILDRASGNPLHLLMLLRYLREESLLEWRDGLWHATDPDEIANVVPPSLGDLFQVRIEQAETHYNIRGLFELLQLAAAIGFRFHYDVLRRLNALNDGEFAEYFEYDLDRLLAEGFLVESEGRDDWYAFSHGLLRDYLVRETGPAQSRRLHRLAAQAWETTPELNTEANALEIARHWQRAGEGDEALRWYLRAGEAARRSFVLRQAMHAYESALGILDAKLGIETSTKEPLGQGKTIEDFRAAEVSAADYLAILSYLGDLHEGFGEYRSAEIAYRRVVRMVSRDTTEFVDPLGWSWLGLGHVAWQRGDFEAAEWAFKKVREIVRPYASQSKLDGEAARGLARVAWHRGEYQIARKLARDSHAIAETIGHDDGQAEASWLLGEVDRILGRPEAARKHYSESMDLYRSLQNPNGIATNFLSLAQVARYQKDFKAARDLYSRALANFEGLGDRRSEGQCLNGMGDIARFEDRHDEADRCYARALEIYEGIGAEYDIAVALANLGLNSIALQDYESAEGYLESALTIVGAGDYPYLLAGVEYNLALVHALRGRADSDEIRSVVDMAERLPIADLDYAQPLAHLASLRANAGDWDEAVALWEKARDIYDELGLHEDRDRVDAALVGDFE